MRVFVLRQGFYHELLGIYTTRELAMEAAQADWQDDQEYHVDEVELDQPARLL